VVLRRVRRIGALMRGEDSRSFGTWMKIEEILRNKQKAQQGKEGKTITREPLELEANTPREKRNVREEHTKWSKEKTVKENVKQGGQINWGGRNERGETGRMTREEKDSKKR